MELAAQNEIRTLFITGLPHDLKEREIYTLFRAYSGYEGCRIQYGPEGSTRPPAVFAIFDNQTHAMEAKEVLQGTRFDPDLPEELRIELAKTNSKPKREREDSFGGRAAKQYRGPQGALTFGNNVGNNRMYMYEPQQMQQLPPPMFQSFEPNQNSFNHGGPPHLGGFVPLDGPYGNPESVVPSGPPGRRGGGHQSNPPCATIYVHNLSADCTESELVNIFSSFAGYKKMLFSTKPGKTPVAWVDFSDDLHSGTALQSLQGFVPSSGSERGGGLKIEFAKQRLRRN